MDGVTLRDVLTRAQFYTLEAQFALLVALTAVNLPPLFKRLAPPRHTVWLVLAVSIFATALVATSVAKTNRIYYDEHIYQGIGQNLSDLRLAQVCNEGTVEYGRLECARGEYNKQPYGYPYVLSVAYRMFGARESIAHTLNALVAGAFVWGVFLTVGALLGDWRSAAFAAFIAAIIPEQLIWSGTAAVEPSASLMLVASMLAAAWFVRARTMPALAWMIAVTAFAVQFRIESALVVVLVALIVVLYARDAVRQGSFWAGVAGGALLCSVHIAHLLAVGNEPWGATGDRIGLEFFQTNLSTNARYFFDNARFPLVVSLLALVGAVYRPTRAACVMSACFALFWGVYLFFYAGSYEYGADVRYALMSHAPVAMLAGRGAAWLTTAVKQLSGRGRHLELGVAAALAFQFLLFMPHVRAVGNEAWAARADVKFATQMASRVGSQAMVLTHNPSIFLLNGVNAAQLSLAVTDSPYVAHALPARYSGGVFLHWNFWCNVDEQAQRALCDNALGRFRNELVQEYRERDQRFALYRLEPGGEEFKDLPPRLLTDH